MAVSTDFTVSPANSNTGLTPPSQSVNFIDLSTGNPDSWLWDFGDGNYSDQQNPTHTYMGSGGESFTVTLKSWIADTPTTPTASSTSTQIKGPHVNYPESAAYADFLAGSYTSNSTDVVAYMTKATGIVVPFNFEYLAGRLSWQYDLPALGVYDVALVVQAELILSDPVLNRTISAPSSKFHVTFNGDVVATVNGSLAPAPWATVFNAGSWAGKAGVDIVATPEPEELLGAALGIYKGVMGRARVRILRTTDPFNQSAATKAGYVTFDTPGGGGGNGDPPVAAFSATHPRKGKESISVSFTDQSTNSPTSYSWKRRPSGIHAPYTEFSTAANPTENFDIENP